MSNLERRVRERLADERKELATARRRAERRAAGVAARHERAEKRYHDALERIGSGRAREQHVEAAMSELTRATVLKLRVANELAEMESRFRVLDSDAELRRRVRLAERLAVVAARSGDEATGRHAVEVVLLHAGRPLHYKEITRMALESGLIRTKGKTPKQTISAYLTRAVQEGDTFVRVEPGVFGLAERDGEAVAA